MLSRSDFLPSKREFFEFLKVRFSTVGVSFDEMTSYLDSALEISEKRFILNKSKYYTSSDGLRAQFNATHYSSHALILYQLARECFLDGRKDLADKVYFLNIATTATDLFYEVDLPLRTGCDHPLGSVIGRARFGADSSLFFRQGCNIGGNRNDKGVLIYPEVHGSLYLNPRSSLIGACTILGFVVLSNGAYVKNCELLKDVVVFGISPNLTIKPIKESTVNNSSVFRYES